jgi:alkanesulfonate monooxygenase SsuD/methylene tetrahydromethanopterin reductase-like flavin-dependent oxidoreductase (luciferase family)
VDLPLDGDLAVGIMATLPSPSTIRETARTVEELGFDSVWVGDHVAWPLPALDPLLQLARFAREVRPLP